MGAPLYVGVPQQGMWWVVGVGLASVSSVWLASVRRMSSSAAPHGGLLWWCLGGGLWLGCSWEGAGHAGSGWLGWGRACVFWPVCLPSCPSAVSSSAFPLPLSFCLFILLCFFFVFFPGGVAGVRRFWCWAWV